MLVHDGEYLRLTARQPASRLLLNRELTHGHPYGYLVPAGDALRKVVKSVAAFERTLYSPSVREEVPPPASQAARVHMRTLQVLDGALAGASQREIATVLFGEDRVNAGWDADSDLRAQVKYSMQQGRAYMTDKYHELLDDL